MNHKHSNLASFTRPDAECQPEDPTRSRNTYEGAYRVVYQINRAAVACLVLGLLCILWGIVLELRK